MDSPSINGRDSAGFGDRQRGDSESHDRTSTDSGLRTFRSRRAEGCAPRTLRRLAQFAAGSLVVAALSARGQYDPDWVRNFRLGGMVGFNIKSHFKLGNGQFNVGGTKPGIFDDGYVIRDPNNTADDYTSNWGYDSASQYDSGAQTLTMHQTTSFTPTGNIKSKTDDSPVPGVDLEYGGYPWRWERFRLGGTIGLGILPLDQSERHSMTADINRSVFTFDTGSHVLFPPAGYQGQPGGDGPNIHSTATSAGNDPIAGATVSGTHHLNANLFALRLGPALFWDATPKLGVTVGAGPALGILSGDLEFKETIDTGGTQSPNRGKVSGTDFVFGGYINATLTYHAVQYGDFYVGVQYMPLGDPKISGAGRQARLDLNGAVYVSAGFNWPF